MGECCTHCSECDRKKVRDEKEYKDLIHRLSRIEGQVRGIPGIRDPVCIKQLQQGTAFQPHQILRCGGYPAGKRRRRG